MLSATAPRPGPFFSALAVPAADALVVGVGTGPVFNDAYPDVIGPHLQEAMRSRAKEFWSKIWPTVGPQVEAVMNPRAATWQEDSLIPQLRHGSVQDLSPVLGWGGEVLGIFIIANDTTERVVGARRQAADRCGAMPLTRFTLVPKDETSRRMASQTFLRSEFLARKAKYLPPRLERQALLHGHCHQKSMVGMGDEVKLLKAMGVDVSKRNGLQHAEQSEGAVEVW